MAMIHVTLQIPGDKVRYADLPNDVPISRLLLALPIKLNWPLFDLDGHPIDYHLIYDEREIEEDETLQQARRSRW